MLLSYTNIIHFLNSINSNNDELMEFKANFYKVAYLVKEESQIADEYRNRSFSVITKSPKKGLFLKQLKELAITNQEQFYREGSLFKLLDTYEISSTKIPTFINFNEKLSILTYQYIDSYVSFSSEYYNDTNFTLIGKTINEINSEFAKIPEPIPIVFQEKYPTKLFLLTSARLDSYSQTYLSALGLSTAFSFFRENEEYLKIVEECVMKWNNGIGKKLIHGDMKAGNFLYNKDTNDFILIDWENVIYGDGEWDLSALLFSIFIKENFEDINQSIERIKNLFQCVLNENSSVNKDLLNLYFLMQIIMYLVDNHGMGQTITSTFMEDLLYRKLNKDEYFFQWS